MQQSIWSCMHAAQPANLAHRKHPGCRAPMQQLEVSTVALSCCLAQPHTDSNMPWVRSLVLWVCCCGSQACSQRLEAQCDGLMGCSRRNKPTKTFEAHRDAHSDAEDELQPAGSVQRVKGDLQEG